MAEEMFLEPVGPPGSSAPSEAAITAAVVETAAATSKPTKKSSSLTGRPKGSDEGDGLTGLILGRFR